MKTIENLEKQLANALARERQLREALNAMAVRAHSNYDWNADPAGITLMVGKALSTSAPRMFTAEEVKPLTNFLSMLESDEVVIWKRNDLAITKDHARKLGMDTVS